LKLPLDKDYFKISIHVIITAAIIYILFLVIDGAAYVIVDIKHVLNNIISIFKKVASLFSPLIIAAVIAYLLDPMADFYQKYYDKLKKDIVIPYLKEKNIIKSDKLEKPEEKFKKRTAGAALSYITLTLIISVFIYVIIVKTGDKDDNLTNTIVNLVNSTISQTSELLSLISKEFAKLDMSDYFEGYLSQIVMYLKNALNGFSSNIVKSITSAGSGIVNFIISLVLGFYIMQHKDYLSYIVSDLMDTFFSKKFNMKARNTAKDFHMVFSGYIRGQLTDAAIMAVLMSITLSMLNIDFAVIIGIVTGFSNLIPYFGALVAFILAVTVALITGPPIKALYAVVAILVLQQIDGIFIVPKVVGERVKLSPPVVIIALAVAGNLFGILGMLFAVPLCAVIKIFIVRYIERYKLNKEIEKTKALSE